MKKIINVLIAVLMIACLAVTFTACKKPCAENEHDWQTQEVTKEATCKEEGSEKVKCAKCGEETTRSIPKAEHKASDIVDIPAVDADCGNAGSHGGRKCNLCGTVTVEPTVDPATGNHNYEGQTYLQDGDKHYQKCKVCGADGSKADHVYDQTGDKCVCGKLDPAVIATIGSVNYKSLSEAVAAGGEITLIKDAAISAKITVTKAVTINLNGRNITLAAQAGTTHINMFAVAEGGALTIKGSGNVRNENANGYVISAYNNGQVIIESGNYYATDCTVVQLDNTAKATIKGGTFAVKGEDEYGTRYVLNKIDSARNSAVFEVMGGSFTNFDPSNSPSEDPAQSFLAEGYKTTVKDGVYTVVEAADYTAIKDLLDKNTAALGATLKEKANTDKYFLVKGTFVEFFSTASSGTTNSKIYGNIYIKDEQGNKILVHGINTVDGKSFNESGIEGLTDIAAGDEITVFGPAQLYNGEAQLNDTIIASWKGTKYFTTEQLLARITIAETNVTYSLDLPGLATWTSNNAAIEITENGVNVTRGDTDTEVVLTATIVNPFTGKEASKNITVTVKAKEGEALRNMTWTFDKSVKTSDQSKALTKDTAKDIIQPESLEVQELGNVYQGKDGTLKFGGGSSKGTATFVVRTDLVASKITINAQAWVGTNGADAAQIIVTVSDKSGKVIKTLDATSLTSEAKDCVLNFDSETNLNGCTIKIEAAKISKCRFYLTSIIATAE